MERRNHTLNAQGRTLGRLAVEAANLLRGKAKQDFAPHKDVGDFVVVLNFSKVRFLGNKGLQKKYHSHSGHIGNLKSETLNELFLRRPAEVLRRAVLGMLPNNKLRAEQIKRLKVEL